MTHLPTITMRYLPYRPPWSFLFFALPQSPIAPTDFDPFQEVMQLIELTKGAFAVVEITREWILQGPFTTTSFPWSIGSSTYGSR